MRSRFFAFALAASAAILAGPALSHPHEEAEGPVKMQFEQMGAYVVSSDLAKSKAFYIKLLDMKPVFQNPVFIGFYIEGGLFGIASKQQFAKDAKIGGNVVPYLRVKDIDEAMLHAKAVAPDNIISKEVVREGPIAIFKMRDPDGNMVEFYSISSAAISSPAD